MKSGGCLADHPNPFDKPTVTADNSPMSKLEIIEAEVRKLPREELVELQDWLADYLEDRAELKEEFVASIERGEADLREGKVRVRKA
jgi:hypothetical protein